MLLGGRYSLQGKLGTGNFSTVWLARDAESRQEVAIKVYRSTARYEAFARDEVRLLEAIRHRGHQAGDAGEGAVAGRGSAASGVVALLGHFDHWGPSCCHPCLVLEAMGPSALELARRCRSDRLPHELLRVLARDALRGLDFLHRRCGVIHTDIKPENILACAARGFGASRGVLAEGPPCKRRRRSSLGGCARWQRAVTRDLLFSEARPGPPPSFGLVDLGNSCFVDRHTSDFIQTCEYKAPEILLGAGYGTAVDLWSLACTLYECATGRYLFDPRRVQLGARPAAEAGGPPAPGPTHQEPIGHLPQGEASSATEEEHVAQIVQLLGPLPAALLRRGRFAPRLLVGTTAGWASRLLRLRLAELPQCGLRARLRACLAEEAEVAALEGLLAPMLRSEPAERLDARTLLCAVPWLAGGGTGAATPPRRTRWAP